MFNSKMTGIVGIVSPVPMGDWQSNVPYIKLNIVRAHSATFIAKKDNINVEPTVGQSWSEIWQIIAYDGGAVSPDGTYPDMQVGYASHADSASKIENFFAMSDKEVLALFG